MCTVYVHAVFQHVRMGSPLEYSCRAVEVLKVSHLVWKVRWTTMETELALRQHQSHSCVRESVRARVRASGYFRRLDSLSPPPSPCCPTLETAFSYSMVEKAAKVEVGARVRWCVHHRLSKEQRKKVGRKIVDLFSGRGVTHTHERSRLLKYLCATGVFKSCLPVCPPDRVTRAKSPRSPDMVEVLRKQM